MTSAKSLIHPISCLILLCLVNVPSLDAQMSSLLNRPDVQKELALTDEQKEKIQDIQNEFVAKRIETTRETRKWFGGNEAERAKLTAEKIYDIQQKVNQKLNQVREAEDQKCFAVLDDKQTKRLNQLYLQRRGVESIRLETVAQQLDLSLQQIEQIEKADRDAGITVLNAQLNARNQVLTQQLRQELMDTANQIKERLQEAYSSILTVEQKNQLAKMQGEAFEFATSTPPRAGRMLDLGGPARRRRKKRGSRSIEIKGTLNIENAESDKDAVFVFTVGDDRYELDFTGGGRARAADVIAMRDMARRVNGMKVVVHGRVTERSVDGKTKKTIIVEGMNSTRNRR